MGEHTKGIVSAVFGLLIILDQLTGWAPGGWFTEAWLTSLLAVIGPVLVWWLPNRP